jgi:hypothetical protein
MGEVINLFGNDLIPDINIENCIECGKPPLVSFDGVLVRIYCDNCGVAVTDDNEYLVCILNWNKVQSCN